MSASGYNTPPHQPPPQERKPPCIYGERKDAKNERKLRKLRELREKLELELESEQIDRCFPAVNHSLASITQGALAQSHSQQPSLESEQRRYRKTNKYLKKSKYKPY